MFFFPVWIFFAGAMLTLTAGSFKAGRVALSVISFLTCISSIMTMVPSLFFTQPRTVGYFRSLLAFRIEPVACAAALCLSVPAAGFALWLAANYGEGLSRVFTLLLLAMCFVTASIFAANPSSIVLCAALTVGTLIFLRKTINEDRKT
jgi:hypothetical protein